MYRQWAPYVPVAERRRQAAAEMAALAKKGQTISPVRIEGRAIATTAWGRAWCDSIEHYSDYANRLPRGQTYVRNGSVVDLQISPGKVEARVSGSSIYCTRITVKPLAAAAWRRLCADCAGGIDSLVELLQGRFAKGVMERLCRRGDGLFPMPKEIAFACSCPDVASLCKHVAAVLYGIGARLDRQPELLFTLRQVEAGDLLAKAGTGIAIDPTASERALATDDVAALFGLEMDSQPAAPEPAAASGTATAKGAASAKHGRRRQRRAAKPPPARVQVAAKRARPGRAASDPLAALRDALRRQGSLTSAMAQQTTGLDAAAVRPLLRRLVAEGAATSQGQTRGTRYVAVRR